MRATAARCYWHHMLLPLLLSPDSLTDHELEAARWHPERETLELASPGAATVLVCSSASSLEIKPRSAFDLFPPRPG